jgi:predicted nucleotidyltransferase
MGISKKAKFGAKGGLASALFTATQQRVLGVLFGQPERDFYGNELISLSAGGAGAIHRELKRLAQAELVTVTKVGNQKHYRANPESPIFRELCDIVLKTVGLADPLRKALNKIAGQIDAAFIYGSVAKRSDTARSDIDVMVISDTLSYADLFDALETSATVIGRSVNPTVYTRKEWAKRVAEKNSFVVRVLAQSKIWLMGDSRVIGS